ncbi:MAG TPA: hypothetical protein VF733_01880 [Candidatus Saccharimonadales bacterium]
MKTLSKLKVLASGMTLSLALVVGFTSAVSAAPVVGAQPPVTSVSGPQSKPAVEPGSRDAKKTEALGITNYAKVDSNGKLQAAPKTFSPLAGNVSGVDFWTPYNYCYHHLVYPTVRNTTATDKYIQVRLYNQSGYRDIYTTIYANSYAYPAFYGVEGSWTAYLYVWNGSTYQYDEYWTGNNTCNVSVVRDYNTSGWVRLAIKNNGTAYASQRSTELAPYPGSGTYTGTQYDYPVAGGATIYRWFQVGYTPYGIVSDTQDSWLTPSYFTGDL